MQDSFGDGPNKPLVPDREHWLLAVGKRRVKLPLGSTVLRITKRQSLSSTHP